ncbi:MAG: squalene--hopene cyclase [Chloroflexota bacterium]|nr:squalene--hopene cyclase [Chloroflexota bacterium]
MRRQDHGEGAETVTHEGLWECVQRAVRRTQAYFFGAQHADGYWWGELESNPTMEAEYIMLTRFLGSDEGDRIPRVAEDIRRRQSPDGSWRMYHGAPGDLSTSIECYLALKLAGDHQSAPHMARARAFIVAAGGIPKARVFTKIWLALFGQWDWKGTPAMPPDLLLLPRWAPLNIYRFASWARATIVPMTIILTLHPTRPPPVDHWVLELYPDGPVSFTLSRWKANPFSLRGGFLLLDRLIRLSLGLPFMPSRARAIMAAMHWIIDHQEADGSWAGIQPPWVYSLVALSALGLPLDHPVVARGLEGFRQHWSLPSADGHALRVQACLSPVWDTCLAMRGLLDAGVPADHPALQRAASWLVDKEIRVAGDWAVYRPHLEPSGWPFEFANDHYPDIDDSAVIVGVLRDTPLGDQERERAKAEAITRAVSWLTGMQCTSGGWAAFDWNNTSRELAKIPFADFGELLDPPSADVTAHVLEMYGKLGCSPDHPAVRRGLAFLWEQQEHDGPWFGRWGVNYIYGTGAVLPALRALGIDMAQPRVRRAVDWLLAHQNPDGGWGETCASYADPRFRGRGESTPSQTSWALIALMAAGERESDAVRRGIAFLIERQREDGTWDEPQFTGCGFPGYGPGDRPDRYESPGGPHEQGPELGAAFMINYALYRNYFPLWALGRYARGL